MRHQATNDLLRRLLQLTKSKLIEWNKDDDGWYSARLHSHFICFRFLFYEATNQLGADPRFIEFSMPGINAVFAFGTEGADLLLEILSVANVGFVSKVDVENGLFLANSILDCLNVKAESGPIV